jgi:hypothetical protein
VISAAFVDVLALSSAVAPTSAPKTPTPFLKMTAMTVCLRPAFVFGVAELSRNQG